MPRIRRTVEKIHKIDEEELIILKKRVDIATALIIVFIAVLIARLWFLQIKKGEEYVKLSENNRIRIQQIQAPRGNILDRFGRVIITNRPYFNLVWTKEDAPNPDDVVKRLAQILHEDISNLLTSIREASGQPRYMPILLKEDIDWKTLVYIENHHFELPGVRVEAVPSRDYLYGNMASHLIGYLGQINKEELENRKDSKYQGGDLIGKMGIEKLYEKELRGEKGYRYLEVDVLGFEQQILRHQDPLPGNDLQLTIDSDLQLTAEKALEGVGGAVVAMDVNTGKLLALASSPPLQLNEFIGGISTKVWQEHLNDPLHPLIDKTIQGQYPPGSTYKIVTALAGLGEKIITPQTIFYCNGGLNIYNRRYGCWKPSGHGAISLQRALSESCDVYFYQVGQRLGVDRLAAYAESLGLGQKTGIDLENEKPGLIPTSVWKKKKKNESWQDGETLSIAIGQGFDLATPLQICRMTAALVNGGKLYKPQIIEAIKDPEGATIKKFQPDLLGTVYGSAQDRKLIIKGLIDAVNTKHGTAGSAKISSITVGGKTGTAQVVRMAKFRSIPQSLLPRKYKDHAWFTCFAPAEKPEIAITVLVEHSGHGGSVAAPIAKQVLEEYFKDKIIVETDQ
ncbi:MAG: penicillin-binding protein 2 [Proteobacteria bacterium]|nr:penicillin-binding protein 2 [Pseudomonadota bacterium]MBU4296826.1 penicillin-binding protein 2 [Pseudomonadota bacterium]MCG2748993.1 penicillin-binding protein 2 [Desulfobulbaceae bacterium]